MSVMQLFAFLLFLCTVTSVSAKGWFIQQFYDPVGDATCSNQYIRTTAFKLDACIVRGHTSTKYTANNAGHTDFQICQDNFCGLYFLLLFFNSIFHLFLTIF